MDKFNSKILILKYIDNIRVDDILEVLNLTKRTFYRRLNRAIKEFESLFNVKVQSNKVILNSFKNEEFLEDIFERIDNFYLQSKNDDICKYSEFICNMIISKMKKAL